MSLKPPLKCPIKIFADFESTLAPVGETSGEIMKYQKHIPISFAMRVVSRIDGLDTKPMTYTGPNADKVYVENLVYVVKFIHKKFPKPVPVLWTKETETKHDAQDECYACHKKFKPDKKDFRYRKVRDHCHYTVKYCGALHS